MTYRETIAGIDPGLSGAIAIIASNGVPSVFDLPVIKYGKSKMIDAMLLSCRLTSDIRHIVIEGQQARPTDGRTSLFTFATVYGQILGAVQVKGIPYTLTKPAVWKKKFGLIGKDKAASHAVAMRLYPKMGKHLYGPRGGALTDRAEALLLAHFYWLQYGE